MHDSDNLPESYRPYDLHRCDFSELEKDTGHRKLIYRYRQCPDCEAHLFPNTFIHKCEVCYQIDDLRGYADYIKVREDKITTKSGLYLLFNQDENGLKTYFVKESFGSKSYECISREKFISMLTA